MPQDPQRKDEYRNRSSITGRFVSVLYALKHAATTVREKVRRRS